MDNGIFQGSLFNGMGDEGQPAHAFKKTADTGLFHAHLFSGMPGLGQDKSGGASGGKSGGTTGDKSGGGAMEKSGGSLPGAPAADEGVRSGLAPVAAETDNTMLYVGIGAGSLVVLGIIGYLAFSKPAPRAVAANRRRRRHRRSRR